MNTPWQKESGIGVPDAGVQTPDARTSDVKAPDAKTPDVETSDVRTPGASGKASSARTPRIGAPGALARDAAAFVRQPARRPPPKRPKRPKRTPPPPPPPDAVAAAVRVLEQAMSAGRQEVQTQIAHRLLVHRALRAALAATKGNLDTPDHHTRLRAVALWLKVRKMAPKKARLLRLAMRAKGVEKPAPIPGTRRAEWAAGGPEAADFTDQNAPATIGNPGE